MSEVAALEEVTAVDAVGDKSEIGVAGDGLKFGRSIG